MRGFFTAAHLVDRERVARGLLTVSAGNAALACAYVARELRVPCRIVMYDTAPALKLNGVRDLGATVVLMPRERVMEWIATRAWEHEPEAFIHPFADEAVITGHSSIVPEILADLPDVERVLVPVGGGGLICGIALGFAALKPEVASSVCSRTDIRCGSRHSRSTGGRRSRPQRSPTAPRHPSTP